MNYSTLHKRETKTGIEPMTSRTHGRRSIHCAMRTHGKQGHLSSHFTAGKCPRVPRPHVPASSHPCIPSPTSQCQSPSPQVPIPFLVTTAKKGQVIINMLIINWYFLGGKIQTMPTKSWYHYLVGFFLKVPRSMVIPFWCDDLTWY